MTQGSDFRECRALVMGLGHFGGGLGAARYLARRGARVTVTDLAPEDRLADALAGLDDVPIHALHLGGHQEDDFRQADLVVVNPAVRPGHPLLGLAEQCGARLTTEIEMFLDACPASMVGVTGSNGKSTTAAMTAAILQADGRRTWLGGNIGQSLLESLDGMSARDWAVLEISSFQLHYLAPTARVPQVAVVTNCVPNHLNWHPDFAHYRASKQRLLTLQTAADAVVLNRLDPEVATWHRCVRGRVVPMLRPDDIPALRVPGEHNRTNAACAGAAGLAAGCSPDAVKVGLASFSGLEQRLERIAEVAGRTFYNDSSATTPESTVAALRALPGPLWLLAGGADKGADYRPMASAVAASAQGAAFFGAVGPRLAQLVSKMAPQLACVALPTLSDALTWCCQHASPGHSVVLSPGCASLDQYVNYRHRGDTFTQLVKALAARPSFE